MSRKGIVEFLIGRPPKNADPNRTCCDGVEIPLPTSWYMSVDGPYPLFDFVLLKLHIDGRVTWRRDES